MHQGLRTRRPQPAGYVPDAGDDPDNQSGTAEQEQLAAERDAVLREALARLPAYCQRLIALLCADPSVPYAEISTQLGIAVGNIGPYRGRCLEKLHHDPAIAALTRADSGTSRWRAARSGSRPDPSRTIPMCGLPPSTGCPKTAPNGSVRRSPWLSWSLSVLSTAGVIDPALTAL
jgi:hypothetical protein